MRRITLAEKFGIEKFRDFCGEKRLLVVEFPNYTYKTKLNSKFCNTR